MAEFLNKSGENQHISGGAGQDSFVIDGPSSDYSWGPTVDGQGIVVWRGGEFKVLHNVETVVFSDGTLSHSGNGNTSFSNSSTDKAESGALANADRGVTIHDTADTQHVSGTSGVDTFVIDGNSADYGWGETGDGSGLVVWSGRDFDVLNDVEQVQFNDGLLVRQDNGSYVLESGSDTDSSDSGSSDSSASDGSSSDDAGSGSSGSSTGTTGSGSSGTGTSTGSGSTGTTAGGSSSSGTTTDGSQQNNQETTPDDTDDPHAANTPPTAVHDNEWTDFNTAITFDPKANDFDAEGHEFRIVDIEEPDNGRIILNPDGTVTYIPNPGFVGIDTFYYTIEDVCGDKGTAQICVDVRKPEDPEPPANRDPVAVKDFATTEEGETITITVLGNDSDPDGDTIRVVDITNGSNGRVSVNPDGTINYTPNPGFTGDDEFTYTISDGKGGFDTATVCVHVDEPEPPANNPPDAVKDFATVEDGETVIIDVLRNDSDPDGDTIRVVDVTNGSNGRVSVNPDGTINYTPNPGFTGDDEFTYTISDGKGGFDTATVCVHVDPPANNPPDAVKDFGNTEAGETVTIDVLRNDSDPDGDAIRITDFTNGLNGTVTVNADGTINYTPNPGFVGDDEFTYTISDGKGGFDTATVCVKVTEPPEPPEPPNNPPDARDDFFEGKGEAISLDVLSNDADPDGDAIRITDITDGANGRVSVNADGTLNYVPNEGFVGRDTFTYTITDGKGGFDTATVTIDVAGPNKINAEIVGDSVINEGDSGRYKVQLDNPVTQDTWFEIQVSDKDANRIDRDDFEVRNQDIIWGGSYTKTTTHKNIFGMVLREEEETIFDRIPEFDADGKFIGDRAAVGPDGVDNWDYTVFKDGAVQGGGTLRVLVKAGETMSESFEVEAWQEKVTVDNANPGAPAFRDEGTESFHIEITDVTNVHDCDEIHVDPKLEVDIIDRTDPKFVSPIALDLNGDGEIGVTGETSSIDKDEDAELGRTVEFDIDGDGDLENIEWFDGSGDGILIDNRDGNAATDMHGGRLFGDEGGQYANGYDKLALLDTDGNGMLTAEELSGLELWVDDGDAVVEEGEFQSLADHGVTGISVREDYVIGEDGRTYIRSEARTDDGRSILTEDVWFASGEDTDEPAAANTTSEGNQVISYTEENNSTDAPIHNFNMEIRFFQAEIEAMG